MSAHKELETKFAPVIYTAQNEGWHPKKLAAALVDLLPADKPKRKHSTGELLCLKALREIYALLNQRHAHTTGGNIYLSLVTDAEILAFPFTITGPNNSELEKLLAEVGL